MRVPSLVMARTSQSLARRHRRRLALQDELFGFRMNRLLRPRLMLGTWLPIDALFES